MLVKQEHDRKACEASKTKCCECQPCCEVKSCCEPIRCQSSSSSSCDCDECRACCPSSSSSCDCEECKPKCKTECKDDCQSPLPAYYSGYGGQPMYELKETCCKPACCEPCITPCEIPCTPCCDPCVPACENQFNPWMQENNDSCHGNVHAQDVFIHESSSSSEELLMASSCSEIDPPLSCTQDCDTIIPIRQAPGLTNNMATPMWGNRISGFNAEWASDVVTDGVNDIIEIGFLNFEVPILGSNQAILKNSVIYNADGTVGGVVSNTWIRDTFIVKYDSNGMFLWVAKITNTVVSVSIAVDKFNNIIITGSYSIGTTSFFNSRNQNVTSIVGTSNSINSYVVKYNAAGEVVSVNNITVPPIISNTTTISATGITTDEQSNVFITGYYNSIDYVSFMNPTVLSTVAANITAMSTNVPMTNLVPAMNNDSTAILVNLNTSNVGATLPPTTDFHAFIAKFDQYGVVQWATSVQPEGTGWTRGFDIVATSQGDAIMTGNYDAALIRAYNAPNATIASNVTLTGSDNIDVFVIRYDRNGQAVWSTKVWNVSAEISFFARGASIAIDCMDNVVINGTYSLAPITFFSAPNGSGNTNATLQKLGDTDVYLAKFSPEGVLLWYTRIGGDGIESIGGSDSFGSTSVAIDQCAHIVVTGNYTGAPVQFTSAGSLITNLALPNTGTRNIYTAKYSPAGQVIWATRQSVDFAQVLPGPLTSDSVSGAVAVDKLNRIIIVGFYRFKPLNLYNTSGDLILSLLNDGDYDAFAAKYVDYGQIIQLNHGNRNGERRQYILEEYMGINTLLAVEQGKMISCNGRGVKALIFCQPQSSVTIVWQQYRWVIESQAFLDIIFD